MIDRHTILGRPRWRAWAACAALAGILTLWGAVAPPWSESALADTGPATRAATKSASRPASRPTTAPASYADAPAGAKITSDGWFAPLKRSEDPPPLPNPVTNAFVIPIRESITSKTFESMERKIMWARSKGAQLIVFDMDTWGGEVIAAMDICRMIKENIGAIYTVCYIRNRAISAGSMIAMACDEIVVSGSGMFGASAPIMPGGSLEGAEREKIESVIRTEFRESAEKNGYWPALAVSIVSWEREVWLVRHVDTRELRYVLRKDWSRKVRETTGTSRRRVEFEIKDGKETVRGTFKIPTPAEPARKNPEAEWELVSVVVAEQELLSMNARQALEWGFAKRQVRASTTGRPWDNLMEEFHVTGEVTVLEDTWSETMVQFLTHPVVTSVLILAAFVCAYSEMRAPGLGIAGGLAVLFFAIAFGSRFLIGLAAWWEIALFVVGLILLGIEIFVIPGFGVFGIAGICCCIIALLAIVVPNAPDKLPIPDTELSWRIFRSGILALGLGFIGSVVVSALLARYLPKMPVAGRMVLAPSTVVPMATTADAPITRVAVGDVGIVHSSCRPVGEVRFGDTLVDAMADGEMIDRGEKVRVIQIEGNRVVIARDETA